LPGLPMFGCVAMLRVVRLAGRRGWRRARRRAGGGAGGAGGRGRRAWWQLVAVGGRRGGRWRGAPARSRDRESHNKKSSESLSALPIFFRFSVFLRS